jgi:hypothetical protein
MRALVVTALVLLSIFCSTASSAAADGTLARDGQRKLQSEDVTRVSAGRHTHWHHAHRRPRPPRRPAASHHPPQLHRAPPDPRAPELTGVNTHSSQWYKQHSVSPSPAYSSGHSSGREPASSHSVHQQPSKPQHSHSSHAASHPPPPGGETLRKVRIQACSVSHGSATEQKTAQVCCQRWTHDVIVKHVNVKHWTSSTQLTPGAKAAP